MTTSDSPASAEVRPGLAMLDACSSGDISALQRLFTELGIQADSHTTYGWHYHPKHYPQGPPAIAPAESEIPSTYELLTKAVAAKQGAVAKFILELYPSFSFMQAASVVNAVLDHPDSAVLQVLLDHQPIFASYSVDYGYRCFLTEACWRPPEKIGPVLHVLLDNGGDVNDGLGPGGGALLAAIQGGQPLDIIAKIVEKGGRVSRGCISTAIQRGRADVVELLLNHKRSEAAGESVEEFKDAAQKSADKEIIAIVQDWAERVTAQGNRVAKRWWRKLL